MRGPGVYLCGYCRTQVEKVAESSRSAMVCIKCGRDVRLEIGSSRRGQYFCTICQSDPLSIVERLLHLAESGENELNSINGYKIQKELNKGGFGAVYLAQHERTGKEVALKIMLPTVAADEFSTAKFRREIRTSKALKHQNVVELYDYGCSNGAFFFTMEFCERGSVAQKMERARRSFSVNAAVDIILQVLEGLDYAHGVKVEVQLEDGTTMHAEGVVHRDLNPQNILLTGSGNSRIAKVADFGLAKAFDTAGFSGLTFTDGTAGKPYFMPRQQVVNFKFAKPEVDVWAAAASLYYMLTRKAPRDFPSANDSDASIRDPWQIVLETEAVPIRKRKSAIPRRLAKVIDIALIDKPCIPYTTAAEFKLALEGAMR